MDRQIRNIPLGSPSLGAAELEAVSETFRSGWVAGPGPSNARARSRVRGALRVAHAIACQQLHRGACTWRCSPSGVGPGDEVVVADYTFPATGHAVMYTGAHARCSSTCVPTPGTIDPDAIEAADHASARAGVIAVDAFGQCADYDELDSHRRRARALFVIEDAACAVGRRLSRSTGGIVRRRRVLLACTAAKGITCGEGGVVITDDEAIADRVRKLSCFGIESAFDAPGVGRAADPRVRRARLQLQALRHPGRDRLRADAAARRVAAAPAPRRRSIYRGTAFDGAHRCTGRNLTTASKSSSRTR